MMKRAILAALLAAPAMASAMSYDFVELAGMGGEVDNPPGTVDTSGFLLGGSFSIHDNVAIQAGASWQSFDTAPPVSIDTNNVLAGLTFHFPASDKVDIVLGAGFGRAYYEATNGFITIEDDDAVTELSAGIRAMPVEKLELVLSVTNTDSFGTDSTGVSAGVRVYVQEKVSLGLSYLDAEDLSAVVGGIRFDI